MASIIRDGDGLTIDHSVAWAGFSMVHKIQHEIAAGFRTDLSELREKEDHAVYSLNQFFPLSFSSLLLSLYKYLVLRVLINKEVFVSVSKKKSGSS